MLEKTTGFQRLGLVTTGVTITTVAYQFLDPYYVRNPEDALVGLWVIFWYWAVYFSVKWVYLGFKK